MEMQFTSSAQVLNLAGLVQGRKVMIVITGATQNCELQFKHASDPNWRKHPGFSGVHTAGVVVEEIRCPSATMRLSFAGVPAGPYFVSVAHESVPSE
jgi:hypothetical protein